MTLFLCGGRVFFGTGSSRVGGCCPTCASAAAGAAACALRAAAIKRDLASDARTLELINFLLLRKGRWPKDGAGLVVVACPVSAAARSSLTDASQWSGCETHDGRLRLKRLGAAVPCGLLTLRGV